MTSAGACSLDSSALGGSGWRLCTGSAGSAQEVRLVNTLHKVHRQCLPQKVVDSNRFKHSPQGHGWHGVTQLRVATALLRFRVSVADVAKKCWLLGTAVVVTAAAVA